MEGMFYLELLAGDRVVTGQVRLVRVDSLGGRAELYAGSLERLLRYAVEGMQHQESK